MDPIPIQYNRGEQAFMLNGQTTDLTLLDFWAWAFSDVITNTTRGIVAEFIVANALGLDIRHSTREAWAKYDLIYCGRGIEVKSAAYHQQWHQEKMSTITFNIPKRRGWDANTGLMDDKSKRQAGIYVLCLLGEKDRSKVNPLNIDQWRFWIIPTEFFNKRQRSQHSITMKSLVREIGEPVAFALIREKVDAIIK